MHVQIIEENTCKHRRNVGIYIYIYVCMHTCTLCMGCRAATHFSAICNYHHRYYGHINIYIYLYIYTIYIYHYDVIWRTTISHYNTYIYKCMYIYKHYTSSTAYLFYSTMLLEIVYSTCTDAVI